MPLIEVKLYDRRVNPEASEKIIKELTEGLCRACGEEVREHTWVVVQGLFLALLVGMLAGIVPSFGAARKPVVQVLHEIF